MFGYRSRYSSGRLLCGLGIACRLLRGFRLEFEGV
jgi:hypothetical protein